MVKKIAIIASSALVIAGLLVLLWPPHVEIGVSDRMLSVSLGTPAYANPDSPLTLQPTNKDAFLRESEPDTNDGTAVFGIVISQDTSRNRRGIFQFELPEELIGKTITSATLSLYCYMLSNSAGRTYWAYRLTRTDWVEAEATWNSYKSGGTWTAAGGDFTTTDGTSTVVPDSAAVWMNWDVKDQVQYAADNEVAIATLIKDGTESEAHESRNARFFTREYTTDISLCPKLIIEYAEPEITNAPDTQAFGYLSEGTSSATAIDKFTITNTGNCTVDVTIQGTDLEGGDDVWDLDDNGDPGENIYALWAGLDDGDDLFDTIIKEGKTNIFVIGLIEDGTQDWGMKIYMPLSIPGCDYVEMSATVTLVASEAE